MRGTMKISVILAHPRPGSFNHAIAEAAASGLREAGHTVIVHDLYAEQFDPLLLHPEIVRDAALPPLVAVHCREIAAADGIVIVHPNWWGMPPAILKGWIDRVLRPGVAYRFLETDSGEGVPIGLLKAQAVIIFNTSNTPALREQEILRGPARADMEGLHRLFLRGTRFFSEDVWCCCHQHGRAAQGMAR